MASIYRAHRLNAYENISDTSKAIFMGMAGSDLVRGFSYDGLIFSHIAYHCMTGKNFSEFLDQHPIKNHLKKLGFKSLDFLLDNQASYPYLSHPLKYLFQVIIPLHFGQDALLMHNLGIKLFLPFLDADYLDFLKETSYFNLNPNGNYRMNNLQSRYRGLYYSARLSGSINKELSGYTLGKGYSANEIVNNQILALSKGLLDKWTRKKNCFKANFAYGEWYWDYLRDYFKHQDINSTGLNQKYLLEKLENSFKSGGEFHFLDYTKAINIHLAGKL